MLVALISIAWLGITLFGVTMCRLAARSDDSHAAALADWFAAGYRAEQEPEPAQSSAEMRPFEPKRGTYRATG